MDYKECFKSRTAVVTGAGSGMGLLASQELAKAGANVVMCDINAEAVEGCAKEIRALGGEATAVVTDVRQFDDAARAAETAVSTYGAIDLLLCLAGGNEARCCNSPKPFYEQPLEVIDWGLDVNLKGPVYFARACMPQMVKQGRGVILLTGSVTGLQGAGCGSMYGTAKSGLFNFVKGLAKAGAPHGVRAVCVSPGPVLTRPGMAAMKTLLGRAAEPIEIVDFMLYLCSDKAAFITGTNHVIDGGRLSL
jgi:NAD(P)-dependent dehydrogenase (short-subunit alcohol dehydrogenase family)